MKLTRLPVLVGVALVIGSVVAVPAAGAKAAKPTVSTLTASPPTTGSSGGTVTLSAAVTNGTTCTFTSNKAVTGLTSMPCTTGVVSDKVTLPPNSTKKTVQYTLKLKVSGSTSAKAVTQVHVTVMSPPPSGLTWAGPASIVVGTPFTVSSIDSCPTTMPDGSAIIGTLYAQESIQFPFTAATNAVPVHPDGSWSLTLSINGLYPAGSFTTTAECIVAPSGTILATYATRPITVSLPG